MRALNGHRDHVLCLESSRDHDFVFASGSQDCSVRLWDARSDRGVRAFKCGHAVNSVLNVRSNEWLVASGVDVVLFDLRKENLPVVVDQFREVAHLGEEVNMIDAHGDSGDPVVVCDDGYLHLLDLNGTVDAKAIPTHPSSVATCVKHVSDHVVVSGGLDNSLCFTDKVVHRVCGKIPVAQQHMFNPPHVHGLDTRASLLGVAVGDGSVLLANLQGLWKKNKIQQAELDQVAQAASFRLDHVHMAATCCVRFGPSNSNLLASGGCDSAVALMKCVQSKSLVGLELVQTRALPFKPNSILFPTCTPCQYLVCGASNTILAIPFETN